MRAASMLVLALACTVSLGLLAGCNTPPDTTPTQQLRFPVILITGTAPSDGLPSKAEAVSDEVGLRLMRVQLFSALSDTTRAAPPIVIDRLATIYDMTDIKGERGGAWMMLNPTGLMPVHFSLVRREERGLDAAKRMIESSDYLGHGGVSEIRSQRIERIRAAKNMADIITLIDADPDTL